MQLLPGLFISLTIAATAKCSLTNLSLGFDGNILTKDFQQILAEVQAERSFETMLMIHHHQGNEAMLQGIYRHPPTPKVIVTPKSSGFAYRTKYNAEILTVLIMSRIMDEPLLALAAHTLDYMRQTRILILAENVKDLATLQYELLKSCEKYKMTNVLLGIVQQISQYYMLLPYPDYHWDVFRPYSAVYFPQHWRNLYNKTLWTLTDQTPPRAILFEDREGRLKLNGFTARLVMLFAERFKAHLRMSQPLKVGEATHWTAINQMMKNNQLDIPMVTDTGADERWLNMTDSFEIAKGLIMIPCAQPRSTRELYSLLLSWHFFSSLVICTLSLSLLHSMYDYVFDGLLQPSNFALSHRILPGVLGQSFTARRAPWRGLKLVYLLLFFAGLNISTKFAANVQTLFTKPSYHRQIQTMQDLKDSRLQILLDAIEAEFILPWIATISGSVVVTHNSTYLQETRQHFNTSYGYYASSALWQMLSRKQQYFRHKVFCTTDDLTPLPLMMWALRLQHNSPYKEAMNYLIHRVHDLGLIQAWHSSTFTDMLKLKQISLRDPNPERGAQALTVNDLYWTWLIVALGLMASAVVFLIELLVDYRR